MEDWFFNRLDKMKRIFLAFISLFFILSCGNGVNKLDDEYLGNIKKNQPYSAMIILPKRIVNELSFSIKFTPDTSGLTWFVKEELSSPGIKNYDKIFIEGKPNVTNDIYIDFYWTTYGTNMSSGKHFQK
ncbi:hypothetical protein HYE60_01470, partial [Aggregatibacter actinomycetemcomitans]|uniref:hypothetical protein n=1 Tax=Aggregatibacter actinomycetemcomitans TaxID=714 RepID=UPI00197B6852